MSEISKDLFANSVYDKTAAQDNNSIPEVLAATGLYGASAVGKATLLPRMQKLLKTADSAEGQRLAGTIFEKARQQGIGVKELTSAPNSFYVSNTTHKLMNRFPKYKELVSRVMGDGGALAAPGAAGDSINSIRRGEIAAHELGHALHYNGRNGSMAGKAAHRLMPASKIALHPALALGVGYYSGKRAAEGDDSILNKLMPLFPVAASIPMLGAESAASLRGMKELKNLGASKAYLKGARGNLAKALGTYALLPLGATGLSYAGRALGKYRNRDK